jgi:phosphopantothenoylcysteine decarboxylase/phosphopantothenate--cysteine ligase
MDSQNAHKNATNMLDHKELDAVCLNILKDSSSFGSDTNKIEFIKANQAESIEYGDKLSVALEILDHAKNI